ncbi:MAG: hypothetical protein QOG49_1673 [Frankiaceae bacterium]|nr:hypothetical protein [Frankiaceae bacterium]
MRLVLHARSRLFAAALLIAGTLATATSAAPAYAADPLGGPALGSTGVVADRSAGMPALPAAVTAEGWLVADLDTGAVIAARNPHGKFLPASTLKTLTALVLLPRLSPTRLVKPSQAAANIGGTKVGIKPGFPVTIDLLFTGMLIYSGNDTATALAQAAGGEPATVALMNAEAKRIQANDTLAVNVTGLDATAQYSSPYDLALMGRAALKIDAYKHYTAIKKAMVPAPTGSFEIANKNALLYNYPGTFGGKTGGTTKALQTYIGYAERGGHRLVVTIMKTHHWRTEAPMLLDYGFAADGVVTPVGQLVPTLDEIAAGVPSASTTAAAGSTAATAAPAGAVAAKKKHKSIVRLPSIGLHFRWWYAAVAGVVAALLTIGFGWRARRRRRHGFYARQTKLRLPVR